MPLEKELFEFQDFFEVIDNTVIISATDENGIIIYANPLFCKISGYSADELIGSDHRIVNSGLHPKSYFENLWRTLKEGKQWKGIISNKAKNGHIYHVKTTISPLVLTNGTKCYLSIRKDITQEVELSNELEFINETHKMASSAANLGAWDWNIQRNTLYWNDQIYNIFEVEPQSFEATYEAFLSYCYPEDIEKINKAVELTLSNPNIPYQIEHRCLTHQGNIKWVLETGKVFRDEEGNPTRMLGIVQDITTLNLQKEQLSKQNELILEASKMSAIGEMAGSISHEINTPIAVILGNAEKTIRLLKDQKIADLDEVMTSLSSIINTSIHISEIVRTLKKISRSDFHEEKLKTIYIKNVLQDLLTISSEKIKNHGIELYFEIENEKETVVTNNSLLQQILINLLNNSMHAIRDLDEKWIKISGKKTNEFYLLQVIDSGKGIRPKIVEKMFQPFFTTKEVGQGTGIGLGVSSSYAQALGGTLSYDESCGNTCFQLKIPAKS